MGALSRLQQAPEGENPPEYIGVVHEAALRMQFGGGKVARAQLEHLLYVSRRRADRQLRDFIRNIANSL